MAERRMFAKTIIDSDAFLDMSVTARLLYYDLSMRADDDGFVNSPKKIMRMVGASEDDLRMLAMRKFIIPFDNGVVVIKHWRIHNYIRKDRYNETTYSEQKELLEFDENGAYRLIEKQRLTDGIPMVDQRLTQVRLGKDRLGKDRLDKNIRGFTPPSIDEVSAYCTERNNGIDPQHFVDFYEAKGWMVGKNKMKDWKAALANWNKEDSNGNKRTNTYGRAGLENHQGVSGHPDEADTGTGHGGGAEAPTDYTERF